MVAPQTYVLKEALKEKSVDLRPRTELAAVPFFPQIDYYCGPSSLAMVLQAAGVDVKPEALVDQVFLPGRKGSLQVEMLAAARRDGLIAYEIEPRVTDLLRELAAGTPAIVLENYGPFSWFPVWHYSVVVGYDLPELQVIRRSGTRARITTPLTIFEKIWKEEKILGDSCHSARSRSRDRERGTLHGCRRRPRANRPDAQRDHGLRHPAQTLAGEPCGRLGRGNAAYALHDLATAEDSFRQATVDHSGAAAAFNNLAQVLAERGKLYEALPATERAVSLGGPLLVITQATPAEIRKASPEK